MLAVRVLVLLRLLASASAGQSSRYPQYELPSKRHFPNSTVVRFDSEPPPDQSHESETRMQTSTMRGPPSDQVYISTDASPSVRTAVDQTSLLPEPAPATSVTSRLDSPSNVPPIQLSSPARLSRPQPSRTLITSLQPPAKGPSPSEETRTAAASTWKHNTEDAAPESAQLTTAPRHTLNTEPSTELPLTTDPDTTPFEGPDQSPLPLLPSSLPLSYNSEAESVTVDEDPSPLSLLPSSLLPSSSLPSSSLPSSLPLSDNSEAESVTIDEDPADAVSGTTLPSSEARGPETRTLAPGAEVPLQTSADAPSTASPPTDRPPPADTEKQSALSEPPVTSKEFPEMAVVGQFEGPTRSATDGSDATPAADIDTAHRTEDDSPDRTMDRLTSATIDSSGPSRSGPITITTDDNQSLDKSDDRPGSATTAHHDGPENDALYSGDDPEPSLKQKAANAGIVIGAAGGAAILGVSVFVLSRRYRQRRLLYNQVGSASSSQSSLEIRCAGLGGPQASSPLPRTTPLRRRDQ